MSEEQVLERISDSKAKILHKYNPDKLVRPDMPPVIYIVKQMMTE